MVEVRARVTLVIEMEVPGVWGENCPLSMVYAQGAESALEQLRTGLVVDGQTSSLQAVPSRRPRVRIVGEPRVVSILTEPTR